MDLSSLEGPPMLDCRFSSAAPSTHSVIPHIRLENIQSPVSPLDSNSWDLPPRPASTSAIIPPRSKYPSTGFWQSMHPAGSSSSNHVTSAPRSQPMQSTGYTASYRPSSSSGSNSHNNATGPLTSASTTTLLSTSQPTPRPTTRPHSSSYSNPHQLVWIESEQIWILTTRTTPPSAHAPHHHHHRSRSSLAPAPNPNFAAGAGTTGLSHSRSMELYPSASTSITEFWGDATEPEDLPPPYEQHIFDQPLGPILPAVRRVPREEVQQIRGSRWSEIGRRVT
ncbi:hypothetical protein BJX64DRAFT_114104 [Aspergillus heterothallicus]